MSSQDPRHTPSDPSRRDSTEGDGAAGSAADQPSSSSMGQAHAAPAFGNGAPAGDQGPRPGGGHGPYGQPPHAGAGHGTQGHQAYGGQQQAAGPSYDQPYGGHQQMPGQGRPYAQQPGFGDQGTGGQQHGHGYQYTAQGNYGQATFQPGGQPLSPSDARTWALISHLAGPALSLLSAGLIGFFAPLVLWLIFKDRDPLVRNASAGAFNFNVIMLALSLALLVLGFLTLGLGWFLLIIPPILSVVFGILGAIEASKGQAYKYPMQIPILS